MQRCTQQWPQQAISAAFWRHSSEVETLLQDCLNVRRLGGTGAPSRSVSNVQTEKTSWLTATKQARRHHMLQGTRSGCCPSLPWWHKQMPCSTVHHVAGKFKRALTSTRLQAPETLRVT